VGRLRRSASWLLAPLACALCAASGAAFPVPQVAGGEEKISPIVERLTPHYRVRDQGSEAEAETFGEILEQCWPAFREFFKAQPALHEGERLTVRVFATRDEYKLGVAQDHADLPQRADPAWYCGKTQTAYMYRLPAEYNTRAVLIYVACLQFHGVAKFKNLDLDWAWYLHGLGQSFGVHAWDGKKLELAWRPRICLTDYPARALARLGGAKSTADPWAEDTIVDPDVRWCAVRFALTGANGKYRAQFERFALGYNGSKMSGEDFARALGRRANVTKEFREWLLAEQMPLEVAIGDWEELDDGRIVGRAGADSVAVCCAKDGAQSLEAVLENVSDLHSTAGVVLSFASVDDYVIGRIVPPLIRVEWIAKGRSVSSCVLSFGRGDIENVLVKMRRDGHKVRMNVDGRELDAVEVPNGKMGLAAMGKPMTFRDVKTH
jgi:hypothetical protein